MNQGLLISAALLLLLACLLIRRRRVEPPRFRQVVLGLGAFVLAYSFLLTSSVAGLVVAELPWAVAALPAALWAGLCSLGLGLMMGSGPKLEFGALAAAVVITFTSTFAGFTLAMEHPIASAIDPNAYSEFLSRFGCHSWLELYGFASASAFTGAYGGAALVKPIARIINSMRQ
jgi:hypothetical protein